MIREREGEVGDVKRKGTAMLPRRSFWKLLPPCTNVPDTLRT
jgi:hypothetical protein